MKVLIPVMKFIIPALLELLKWYIANVLQVDLPTCLLSGHKEWKSLFCLSLSFITNQMCHLAGQEYFYCQWCCFHWPQFQKLLRRKQNKISYSDLFDFSDVDLMKQTLFQGLKSFSPKCPTNPMPASLYTNVAVEVLCQEKYFGFCFFAFFFFLYRLQHGVGCSSCVWETSPSSFTCLLVVIRLLMLGRGWSELNQTLSLPLILSQASDRGPGSAKRMWEVWAKPQGGRDGRWWGSAGLGSREGGGHLPLGQWAEGNWR